MRLARQRGAGSSGGPDMSRNKPGTQGPRQSLRPRPRRPGERHSRQMSWPRTQGVQGPWGVFECSTETCSRAAPPRSANPGSTAEMWRRKWQPTPMFLPGESHGSRNLVGYSLWGCKEWDMTEQLRHTHTHTHTHTLSLSLSLSQEIKTT